MITRGGKGESEGRRTVFKDTHLGCSCQPYRSSNSTRERDFGDDLATVLLLHQESLAKSTLHFAYACHGRWNVTQSRSYTAESIEIEIYVASSQLLLFIDQEMAVRICKELIPADWFSYLNMSNVDMAALLFDWQLPRQRMDSWAVGCDCRIRLIPLNMENMVSSVVVVVSRQTMDV